MVQFGLQKQFGEILYVLCREGERVYSEYKV